jgi:hypothetical protein
MGLISLLDKLIRSNLSYQYNASAQVPISMFSSNSFQQVHNVTFKQANIPIHKVIWKIPPTKTIYINNDAN